MMLFYKHSTGDPNMQHQTTEALKHAGDAASATILVGTLLDKLPAFAAAVTIVYTAIRTWETRTVQGWVQRLKSWLK